MVTDDMQNTPKEFRHFVGINSHHIYAGIKRKSHLPSPSPLEKGRGGVVSYPPN
jgi:hypothetical protein